MDLSKLSIKPLKRNEATDPEEIFKGLTLRGTVENIWGPQLEALKAWNTSRSKEDIVIEMSTGGGKTLVGLLIAQSLVNETKGKVLYLCPTNQLVEQTSSRASECSLEFATYMGGKWNSEEAYDSCRGPCITNYAAAFNGLSIFRDHDLRAIVFDDAHVSNAVIRSQYTLKISRSHPAFGELSNFFRPQFIRDSKVQQFEDALNGDRLALLFVPLFEVRRLEDKIRQLLLKKGVNEAKETKFAWEHLKDKFSRCAILVSGTGIEITPPMLPLHTSPLFRPNIRRIYMTATMPSHIQFLRTFPISETTHIQPGGKSGEAQRQLLFLDADNDDDLRKQALSLVKDRKACIITPSTPSADAWCPPAKKYDGAAGHAGIDTFAKSKGKEKIVLVARYDGVDLPGDSCRILILDGLPVGSSLFDRFIDQGLRIEKLRVAQAASRIVQAIGRIFRSNTDHGAILLCGTALKRWFQDPNHRQYMPQLLQKQSQLGLELRRLVDEKKATFAELLDGVLSGRKDWDTLYSQSIEQFESGVTPKGPEWLAKFVEGERKAFRALWEGNFAAAATEYASLADDAEQEDKSLAAYYHHLEGLAHDLAKNDVAALVAYVRAANERAELGRPVAKVTTTSIDASKPSPQAIRISKLFESSRAKYKETMTSIETGLAYGPKTKTAEQALCDLGTLLGLVSSRPDNSSHKGPDVLWCEPDSLTGIAIEAKTDKETGSTYQKKEDIGQFHDHVQWLKDNHPDYSFRKVITGRKLRVSINASPPDDLRIVTLEQFQGLLDRLVKFVAFLEAASSNKTTETIVENGIREFGLAWPKCVDSLEGLLAVDLQNADLGDVPDA
jgi:hypothetical protein